MLRLQTAKLPATVMAFCHDYVIKLCATRKSLFSAQAIAKLFCRNGVMLPLGKHSHFAS